jgi:hypothetical protein
MLRLMTRWLTQSLTRGAPLVIAMVLAGYGGRTHQNTNRRDSAGTGGASLGGDASTAGFGGTLGDAGMAAMGGTASVHILEAFHENDRDTAILHHIPKSVKL